VFSDVASNHWAHSYIYSDYAKGWINGYTDGTFRPNQSITRAEAVTIINNMLDRKVDEAALPNVANPFTDVSSSHWAYKNILEAALPHSAEKDENGNEIWTKY